jgi:hypothetical protein
MQIQNTHVALEEGHATVLLLREPGAHINIGHKKSEPTSARS